MCAGVAMVAPTCGRRLVESRTRALFSQLMGTTTYRHLSARLVEEAATACFLAAVAELQRQPLPSLAVAHAELRRSHRVTRAGVVFTARALGGGRVHLSFADVGGRQ